MAKSQSVPAYGSYESVDGRNTRRVTGKFVNSSGLSRERSVPPKQSVASADTLDDITTEEVSVVEKVLDSAAEYIAVNTSHPKLPGKLPFSLAVQLLRCLRGMTQHQLAEACEVKQSYISMVEKKQGKVPKDAIARIRAFLELPVEDAQLDDAGSRQAESPSAEEAMA